ncbi:hypothetical protein [Mesorhizobium sp.]|uniref:hypothetical protein n=1 Tax=Mesorhizobium sp. TaxID=1871066 RepID=UPI000FE33115|nr:hypothetical protein [Mesorhizobium sp.]RWJ97006.1 MAG: hypothetical protein EOR42_29460 [Mesorhizobium sp.]
MRSPKDHPAQLILFDELDTPDASAADRPDAAQGVRPSTVAAMTTHAVICAGCDAPFSPNRPDQRCCSASCRKRLERRRKRDKVVLTTGNVTRAPDERGDRENRPPKRFPRPAFLSRVPEGYPPGLGMRADADGLPIFFDAQGNRLCRIWGSKRLSAVELHTMKLESAEIEFPGGCFYRKLPA